MNVKVVKTKGLYHTVKNVSGPIRGNLAEYPAPPKEKSSMDGIQSCTFITSLVVQFVVLIISFATLGHEGTPPILQLALVLETVIQGIEFAWYVIVGVLAYWGGQDINVSSRYIDWVFTTPVMLSTLLLLLIWSDPLNECRLVEDAVSDIQSFWYVIFALVICDWLMLLVGWLIEASPLGVFTDPPDSVVKRWSRRARQWVLLIGFVPLVIGFSMYPYVANESLNIPGWSIALVAITFVLWIFYGLVAIVFEGKERKQQQYRNAFYNILDIFSKNVAGLVVSIIALNTEPCPADLGSGEIGSG